MTIATTFTWFPDIGAQATPKLAVSESKFGDGYSQRAPTGLNARSDTWSVTFTRPRAIGLLILAFMRARKASESFNWTTPLNEAGVYVCKKWNHSSTIPGMLTITADFEQVFES